MESHAQITANHLQARGLQSDRVTANNCLRAESIVIVWRNSARAARDSDSETRVQM